MVGTGLGVCKLDVKQSKNLNQEISLKDFTVVATSTCLQITQQADEL
jgi:hypothetical protein